MNLTDYLTRQLKTGEAIVQIVRRHPATMIPAVGGGGLVAVIDFFLLAWWFRHHGWGALGFIAMLVISAWLVIRGIYLWRHNAMAVTNQRVIDIDQRGFFERHVAEATYDKIQDVRYTIRGLWPTIFRFGQIEMQTAGNSTNLEMDAISKPMEFQQLVTDLQRQAQAKQPSDLTANELLTVVERLKDQLGPDGVERLLRKQPPLKNG